MHLEQHRETIDACRFCFMCRHLSAVGNVTFRESDTPRGRALIAGLLLQGLREQASPDYVDAFYRAELSGANRRHCVSHYDEVGLVLAARRDLVEAGLAPTPVRTLAAELQQATFRCEGAADMLYYADPDSGPEFAPSGCAVLSGGDAGMALDVLGFTAEAQAVLERFRKTVAKTGARTLLTSSPAAWHWLSQRLPYLAVRHTAEVLPGHPGKGELFYLESDFLHGDDAPSPSPAERLARLGYTVRPFGTNREESYAAGEGAVVFDRLHPALAERMCRRIESLADHPDRDCLATPSPYTRRVLRRYAPRLNVLLLD